jgi:methionyl-tRNA formyltransferase
VRAIFFGTPAIAVPALDALARRAEVACVICQPDRPAGRGLTLKAPPVKERALELGVRVEQPAKIRTPEFAALLRELGADFALVIAYGRILPRAVLEAPRAGCLNLHASILPKYRGAAPITWAIVRGERVTGISLMKMDEGMDTGPVFSIHETPIGPDTTADELSRELGSLAAAVVERDVLRAVSGELEARPQDEAEATTAPLLKKEDGLVDWRRPAREVHDHVRGMTSWPGAFTLSGGKTLKLLETRVATEGPAGAPAGTVQVRDKDLVEVACDPGTVRIVVAQLEGRKALGARDLIAGRALVDGAMLGSLR